jgi:hypothetical protein
MIPYLDFGLEDKVGIARVGETEYTSELIDSEVAYVANLELGGLLRVNS